MEFWQLLMCSFAKKIHGDVSNAWHQARVMFFHIPCERVAYVGYQTTQPNEGVGWRVSTPTVVRQKQTLPTTSGRECALTSVVHFVVYSQSVRLDSDILRPSTSVQVIDIRHTWHHLPHVKIAWRQGPSVRRWKNSTTSYSENWMCLAHANRSLLYSPSLTLQKHYAYVDSHTHLHNLKKTLAPL